MGGHFPRVISTLTLSIDLNTLHALSLTSRSVRASILPYRAQLVRRTLRCVNDYSFASTATAISTSTSTDDSAASSTAASTDSAASASTLSISRDGSREWEPQDDGHKGGSGGLADGPVVRRLGRGKVGPCARDMVGECRRCRTVVCRVSSQFSFFQKFLYFNSFRDGPMLF